MELPAEEMYMVLRKLVDATEAGRTQLTETESKAVIAEVGMPVAISRLATTQHEAVAFAREIGFPVALKIASPDIAHKSDVGGVRLGIQSEGEVRESYAEVLTYVKQQAPTATIHGVSVQKMTRPGTEVIIGATRDPQFGPVLMFGLGGVMVELLRDVSFRVIPLHRWDAGQMIRELDAYPLLEGFRGQEPADMAALEALLLSVSGLVENNPEIRELDLNPVFAYKDGALVVDARITLEPQEKEET